MNQNIIIINSSWFHAAEKSSSETGGKDKLKRDSSSTGTNMVSVERLRPIGASADEEVYEDEVINTQQQEGSGERPVHIIIKTQEEMSKERNDSQEPPQW